MNYFRCALVALLAYTAAAGAAERVFECKDAAGKKTYTNVPCEGQVLKPEALEESAYKTPYGEWLGQIQFKETTSKSASAHTVSPLTIKIEAGGRLTGASAETGCRMLGIAAPSAAATVVSLDLTVTDCCDSTFSRHYNGTLGLYAAQRYAQLLLISVPRLGDMPPHTYDLTGIMRR